MQSSFPELIKTFLKIGLLGFGGPYAHIAILKDEIVKQRNWVSNQDFEEGLGLCEVLPGPASSQLAIYLGMKIRGQAGGFISGICFLIPGLLIVLLLSQLWRQGQSIDSFEDIVSITQVVVASIIWAFAWRLLQKRSHLWQISIASFVLIGTLIDQFTSIHLPVIMLLLLAGLFNLFRYKSKNYIGLFIWPLGLDHIHFGSSVISPFNLLTILVLGEEKEDVFIIHLKLFLLFLKAGLFVFGGGLVIIPLLQNQIIEMGWLNIQGFLDGLAIGQLSPGPVVLTSAFVGYQAGWNEGGLLLALSLAVTATFGIFLPSFIFVLIGTPFLEGLKRKVSVNIFLNGILSGLPGAIIGAAIPMTSIALEVNSMIELIPRLLLLMITILLIITNKVKPFQLIATTIGVGLVGTILPK